MGTRGATALMLSRMAEDIADLPSPQRTTAVTAKGSERRKENADSASRLTQLAGTQSRTALHTGSSLCPAGMTRTVLGSSQTVGGCVMPVLVLAVACAVMPTHRATAMPPLRRSAEGRLSIRIHATYHLETEPAARQIASLGNSVTLRCREASPERRQPPTSGTEAAISLHAGRYWSAERIDARATVIAALARHSSTSC